MANKSGIIFYFLELYKPYLPMKFPQPLETLIKRPHGMGKGEHSWRQRNATGMKTAGGWLRRRLF